jgi:hypothetical protein
MNIRRLVSFSDIESLSPKITLSHHGTCIAKPQTGITRSSVMKKGVSSCLLVMVVAGCGINDEILSQSQFDQRQSDNLSLEMVSGNLQSGTVGTVAPEPLVVRVVDENQKQIDENEIVTFSVESGDAMISGKTETHPDSDGLASAYIQFGQKVATVIIRASIGAPVQDDLKHEVLFTLNGKAGPATSLSFVSGHLIDSTPPCVGEGLTYPEQVKLRAADRYDNAVEGQEVIVDPDSNSSVDGLANGAGKLFLADAEGMVAFTLKAGSVTGSGYNATTTVYASLHNSGASGAATSAIFELTRRNFIMFNGVPLYNFGNGILSLTGIWYLKIPIKIQALRSCWVPVKGLEISVARSWTANVCSIFGPWSNEEDFGTMVTDSFGRASATANVPVGVINFSPFYSNQLTFTATNMNTLVTYAAYEGCEP